MTHQAQPTDAASSVSTKVYNQAPARAQVGDGTINVTRKVDSNSPWEHRDF
jgi:hypothetical protein